MSAPNPEPENKTPLRETLLRDAACVGEPPFDAALHHAAMRRIRALAAPQQIRLAWRWALASAAAALLLLGGLAALRNSESATPAVAEAESARAAIAHPSGAVGLAWTYRRAAMEGDDALQAMLDRDARTLLAASASAFSTPLP